jgi:hypothetical protein
MPFDALPRLVTRGAEPRGFPSSPSGEKTRVEDRRQRVVPVFAADFFVTVVFWAGFASLTSMA